VILLLLILLADLPLGPDARLTPGAIATTNTAAVCTPGYAGRARDVSLATKRAVYAAYGLMPAGRFRISAAGLRVWQSDFEVDHLVSLQLGGSNAPANLWPQSYRTKRWNATAKDALENRLHWLVCHDRLQLAEAQRVIRANWMVAYDAFITHGPHGSAPQD
jgi:hypothetical protein